eukprot:COSAG05_NODE_3442_length_2060_cov_5.664196_4_plen_55_part_00
MSQCRSLVTRAPQINTVNEVLNANQQALNDQKNGVVQFLKDHELDQRLVTESVR